MSVPVDDWQFWVVTLLFLVCVWLVVRPLLPRRGGARKKVKLTIKGSGRGPSR